MPPIEKNIQLAYGTAFAVLNRQYQDTQLVEDALQHACLRAVENWPEGLPQSPKAWLIKVAANFIVDHFRKHKPDYIDDIDVANPVNLAYQFEDAVLGLIFTCCHPCLAPENQLAICLKWVMGFNHASISRALIVSEKTLEQRITRSKRKLASNKIEFTQPPTRHLKARLSSVLKTLYLIFNEGYYCNAGDHTFSVVLCEQAIYLTRVLSRSFRGNSDTLALLALMLFIYARSPSRKPEEIVLLENQDRSKWNKQLIKEADVILQKALKLDKPSTYHIQAAIAGVHSQANSYQQTDWQQICLLYDKLLTYEYSPIAIINQAVAHMQLKEWQTAEEKLEVIGSSVTSYPPYFIALSHLYEHTNRLSSAINKLQHAIDLSKNMSEKRFLTLKLTTLKAQG